MKDLLRVLSNMRGSTERKRSIQTLLESNGQFSLEQFRHGKQINEYLFPNGATNVGKQYMLGAAFAGVTAPSTWYLGLIDGTSGTPVIANADTMGSHAWSEFAYYDEASRQIWAKAVNTVNNTIASTAPAVFTVSSGAPTGAAIAGGFLCGVSTKGGTTGTIWAHGLLTNPVSVEATDIFRINYTTGL